jgi:beta-glucosidase
VVALGESNVRSGEANSVADIVLPPGQEELLEILSRFGKPVVAVICAGRPLALTKVSKYADAVLYAWHPGTQGGLAIADILFGDVNPSGRLPVTMLRHVGQIPLYYNRKSNGRPINEYYSEAHFINYQDMPGSPLYPFGYGLSYTTFKYEDIKLNKTIIGMSEEIEVSAVITNTGTRAGEEVVQCYVRDKVSSVTRSVKELKGFKRINLKPGQSESITFTLGYDELSFYGRDGKQIIEPGEFIVWIGSNCLTDLKTEFKIIS